MKTYQSINSPSIFNLVTNFKDYLFAHGIEDFNNSKHINLRILMIDYFKTKEFQDDYFKMAISILKKLEIDPQNRMLQKIPTPRIFRPKDHGTSFHSDYWYGHGEKTVTIWTPLSELILGNSFSIISNQQLNEIMTQELNESSGVATLEQEKKLMEASDHVIIPIGSSVIFPSRIIHGSPKNSTNRVRVSFDFRIADLRDETSTKDPHSYFQWSNGTFLLAKNKFAGLKFIKYICGGEHKSTLSQHLIIESVVKEYEINISGQEAEIERFGHPIFKAYLESVAINKNVDGLIIASKTILDSTAIEAATKNKRIKIYCALENEFIDTLR
jgi:hypothetical protein